METTNDKTWAEKRDERKQNAHGKINKHDNME